MNHNDKVTEKGLEYLINGCPNFKYFNHGGWGTISTIKEIEFKYPQISFSSPKQRIH